MKILANNYRAYWYLIAFLPIIWGIGGEQFLLPIVIILLFMKRLVIGGVVFSRNAPLVLWFLWLFFVIISMLMIEEDYRYLTWIRNFAVAFSGVALAYLVYESHFQIELIKKFFYLLLGYSTVCSIAGLLGVLGYNFSYMSPMGVLLGVGKGGYLHDIFIRSFVQSEALWFLEGFIRTKGILLYSNLLSGVVLVGAIGKGYILLTRKNSFLFMALLLVLLFFDGVVVVSTLSRSAWIGLASAMLTILLFVRLGAAAKIFMVLLLVAVTIVALFFDVDMLISRRFIEKAHSNQERMLNYVLIGQAVTSDLSHFLLGFGTQRDVWEMDIPLGSHSTYLGLLFKYGFLGLSLYMSALILMLIRLRDAIRLDANDRFLGAALMSSLVQIAVQGLFIEIDVDVVYSVVWWILVALCIAYTEIIYRRYYAS